MFWFDGKDCFVFYLGLVCLLGDPEENSYLCLLCQEYQQVSVDGFRNLLWNIHITDISNEHSLKMNHKTNVYIPRPLRKKRVLLPITQQAHQLWHSILCSVPLPFIQVRTQRLREVTSFTQGHITSSEQSWTQLQLSWCQVCSAFYYDSDDSLNTTRQKKFRLAIFSHFHKWM